MSFNKYLKILINKAEKYVSLGCYRFFAGSPAEQKKYKHPKKILVIKLCCFGDAIISLHALKVFRKKNPELSISVLCSHRIEDIYKSVDFIDKVYVLPLTGKNLFQELIKTGFWRTLFKTLGILKSQQFSELYDMELYRYFPVWLKGVLKIPLSRGFSLEGVSSKPHNVIIRREKDSPEWMDFFSLFGLSPSDLKRAPVIYERKTKPVSDKPVRVGIIFGSSYNWPQKKWPLKNFICLCDYFLEKKCEIVLLGADYEKPEAEIIHSQFPGKIKNKVGILNYPQLVREFLELDFVLGNDTGPLHLAGACGIKSLTLFGPTNPKKWLAFGSTPAFIDIECRPCYYLSNMPNCSHISCLNHLTVERVVAEIDKIWDF